MLNHALDIFLERGFEQATMEEIAIAVGMSKRTVYARYPDKAALFKAAVHRAIERYTIPIEKLRAAETDDLESTLRAVAHLRVVNIMTPVSIKLQRILSAQSYRFPELFNASFEEGAGPAIDYLSDLFSRYAAKDEIDVENARQAATAFLSLTIGGPTRIIVSGNKIDQADLDARIDFGIRLFLNGLRRR